MICDCEAYTCITGLFNIYYTFIEDNVKQFFTKWISIESQLSCCYRRNLRIFVMPYFGKLQITRNKAVFTCMYKTKYNNWQKGDYFCLINDFLLQIPYWKGKYYVSYIQRRLIDHVNWDYWLLLHLIISGVRLYVLAGRALVWMIAAYGRLDLSFVNEEKGTDLTYDKSDKSPLIINIKAKWK